MFTIHSLNKITKELNIKLVRGEGYFYWVGLTDDMSLKIASLHQNNVSVFRFTHLSEEQWKSEIDYIKLQLKVKSYEL